MYATISRRILSNSKKQQWWVTQLLYSKDSKAKLLLCFNSFLKQAHPFTAWEETVSQQKNTYFACRDYYVQIPESSVKINTCWEQRHLQDPMLLSKCDKCTKRTELPLQPCFHHLTLPTNVPCWGSSLCAQISKKWRLCCGGTQRQLKQKFQHA